MKEHFKNFRKGQQFYTTYPVLLQSKYFKGNIKVLLVLMLNDLEMNGKVQWCYQTYADKSGTTKVMITEYFRQLVQLNVLVPLESNKIGSRHNKFNFSWPTFLELCKSQPVKKSNKAVKNTYKPVKKTNSTGKAALPIQTETDMLQKDNISREVTRNKRVPSNQEILNMNLNFDDYA